MAEKKETLIEVDEVVKAAKKFVKQGKLDELADTWVENREKAEEPNQLVNLLGQVGQFIKENDIEEKLEDLLSEGDSKKTTKKKSTTKKSTSAKKTTKKTATKKTTAKTTKKSSSSSSKKSVSKKTTSAKKTTKKTDK